MYPAEIIMCFILVREQNNKYQNDFGSVAKVLSQMGAQVQLAKLHEGSSDCAAVDGNVAHCVWEIFAGELAVLIKVLKRVLLFVQFGSGIIPHYLFGHNIVRTCGQFR